MKRWNPPGTHIKERLPLEVDPSSQGLDFEEVSFYTRECRDVVLLRGWYIPSENSKKCIIIIHGLRSNRVQTEAKLLEIAKALVDHGYNVLTFDLRAHGESEGKHLSLGYYEAYDILGAHDFLVSKKNIPPQNIGILGFSYGALSAFLAAKKKDIRAMVADSCPGDTVKLTKRQMTRLHIPFFLLPVGEWLMRKVFEIDINELKTMEMVEKIPTPIFFIHGTEDNFPYAEIQELYRVKARNPLDRVWLTEGVGHIASYRTFPEEYIKNIVDFFNKAL